jgi:hypothetical protein
LAVVGALWRPFGRLGMTPFAPIGESIAIGVKDMAVECDPRRSVPNGGFGNFQSVGGWLGSAVLFCSILCSSVQS